MIKKFTIRKFVISTLLLIVAVILYSFPNEKEFKEIVEDKKENIYLLDKNNYVSMVSANIKARNINEYVTGIINNLKNSNNDNFYSVIPYDTKLLSFEIKDDLVKLNFSHELLHSNMQRKMIEAIVYSITEIDGINKVMIFVEDKLLTSLDDGTYLGNVLDRSFGINKITDIDCMNDIQVVNLYFLRYDDEKYYIPVTYITNDNNDKVDIVIKNLKGNILMSNSLLEHINYQVEMANYELNNDTLIIDFNEFSLFGLASNEMIEDVKYAFYYSLKDSLEVKNVFFLINN